MIKTVKGMIEYDTDFANDKASNEEGVRLINEIMTQAVIEGFVGYYTIYNEITVEIALWRNKKEHDLYIERGYEFETIGHLHALVTILNNDLASAKPKYFRIYHSYHATVSFTLDDKNYWLGYDFKRELDAESLDDAYDKIIHYIEDNHLITISKNARQNKAHIYVDTKNGAKSIGWVYRMQTEIDNGTRYVKKNGHAWIVIRQFVD